MRHKHSDSSPRNVSFLAVGKAAKITSTILLSVLLYFSQSAHGQTSGKKKNLFQADPNWGEPEDKASTKKKSKAKSELDAEIESLDQSTNSNSSDDSLDSLDEETPAKKPATKKSAAPKTTPEPKISKSKNKDLDEEVLKDDELDAEPVAKEDFADQELIDQAKNLASAKSFDKATALLWKNVDKLGHNGLAYLASLHLKMKDPSEALRATSLMIARNQKDYEAHWLNGRALVQKFKDKDAAESFNKAIAANKNFLPAYNDLSDLYDRAKNFYEMRIIYQDLIQMKGPRAEFLSKLCEIDARDGVNDQGLEYCDKAIQKDKNQASNYVWKGVIIKQSGNLEKGKIELKKAADKFPDSELAQFTYAEMLREQKDYPEAQTYYEACIQADARSHRCMNGLGLSTYQLQKFDITYSSLKKACFIGGRKYAPSVREALGQIRKSKANDWISKFEDLAQQCAIQ